MFNNYSTNNKININACSGGIYKTYKESWFNYLSLEGNAMQTMFNNYKYDSYKNQYYKDVIILQMILTSKEGYVIAELIKEDDFNKYFENKSEVLNEQEKR